MAYTVSFDASTDKLTAITYMSVDGTNYSLNSKNMTDAAVESLSAGGGIDMGYSATGDVTISYDDVMVFNRALSADEVASIDATFASKSVDNSLMIAYDFEGVKEDVQLKDKAAAGASNDKLSVSGTGVTIENGVATVSGANTFLKTGSKSADLAELNGYTVYMKVKADGTYTSENWTGLLEAAGLFRTFIDGQNGTSFSLQARHKCNSGYGYTHPANISMHAFSYKILKVLFPNSQSTAAKLVFFFGFTK